MICPSCNKFPAYDTSAEPDVDIDVTGEYDTKTPDEKVATANVTGTVRICLTSECCGDDLKEASFDVDEYVELTRAEGCMCDLSDELEVDGSAQLEDRLENKDKNGKIIKSTRYMKQFYGASMTITVKCACDKTSATLDWSDEIQASAMDELV